SELDPTFKKESQDEQPFSDEELKILEEVRRECGAQNKTSKT
nr:serine O-acetyltransferase [Acinetobacter baumannii]